MVSCNQSTLLAIGIAYLLIREHKEVDPLFSSLPSSSRWSQGLQSPTFFNHPRKVFSVVGVGNCFILAVITVKSCQYP